MSWRGPYYYQARKIGGRVVTQYIGRGKIGELVALGDALDRQEREQERNNFLAWKENLADLDEPLEELNDVVDKLAHAALLAAGFHQHRRGEWRKKRNVDGKSGGRSKKGPLS
jgi:hypothetical protein